MALSTHIDIQVHRYSAGRIEPAALTVNTEYPVAFVVNGRHIATIACSGDDLEKLAVGYLFAERIITGSEQLKSFSFHEKNLTVEVSVNSDSFDREKHRPEQILTGGGRSKRNMPDRKFVRRDLPMVRADIICRAAGEFLNYSKLHEITHGVHSAALYDFDGAMIVFFDEIGRHNAIDKVVGHAMMNSIPLGETILFSTGRVSSEIAGKVIHSGIPVFVSRASPTGYAVEMLREYNVLGVCRARDDGFVVINGERSIVA